MSPKYPHSALDKFLQNSCTLLAAVHHILLQIVDDTVLSCCTAETTNSQGSAGRSPNKTVQTTERSGLKERYRDMFSHYFPTLLYVWSFSGPWFFLSSQLHKKFGNIFSLQNCWTNIVVLNGYKTVKEALVNKSEDFADRPYFPVYEHLGYGHKSEGKSFANRHFLQAPAQGGLAG